MIIDITELDVCAMATTSSMANTTTVVMTDQGNRSKPMLSPIIIANLHVYHSILFYMYANNWEEMN